MRHVLPFTRGKPCIACRTCPRTPAGADFLAQPDSHSQYPHLHSARSRVSGRWCQPQLAPLFSGLRPGSGRLVTVTRVKVVWVSIHLVLEDAIRGSARCIADDEHAPTGNIDPDGIGLVGGSFADWLALPAAGSPPRLPDSPRPPPATYGHLVTSQHSEPVIRVMAAPGTSRRRPGQHPSCRQPDESGRRLPPSAAQSTLTARSDVPVVPVIPPTGARPPPVRGNALRN